MVIELVGAQGRGKTSHLRLISQAFPEAPVYFLHNHSAGHPLLEDIGPLVFIDSIHHLNIFQRHKLFKSGKTIVLTTHNRRFLEYQFARIAYRSYAFRGITPDILKTTILNRIKLAAGVLPEGFPTEDLEVEALIARFGDDYRAILNHLYEQFNRAAWKN